MLEDFPGRLKQFEGLIGPFPAMFTRRWRARRGTMGIELIFPFFYVLFGVVCSSAFSLVKDCSFSTMAATTSSGVMVPQSIRMSWYRR